KRWPSESPSFCATTRATLSVPPPAGNGTMTRTGRSGQLSARASATAETIAHSETQNTTTRSMILTPYPHPGRVTSFFSISADNASTLRVRRFTFGRVYYIVFSGGSFANRTRCASKHAIAEPRHLDVRPAQPRPHGLLRLPPCADAESRPV